MLEIVAKKVFGYEPCLKLYLVINGCASPVATESVWDGVDSVLVAAEREEKAVQIAEIFKNEFFPELLTEVSFRGGIVDAVALDDSNSDIDMRLVDAFADAVGQGNYEKLQEQQWFPFEGVQVMELPDGRVHLMSLDSSKHFWTRSFEMAVAFEVSSAKEFLEILDVEDASVSVADEKQC